jgi:hypothetical protein
VVHTRAINTEQQVISGYVPVQRRFETRRRIEDSVLWDGTLCSGVGRHSRSAFILKESGVLEDIKIKAPSSFETSGFITALHSATSRNTRVQI